jgi:hypothetical protein
MKTTLDLPVELVREMKLRAAREGRKLKDVATEVVRRGLAGSATVTGTEPRRVTLPLIECRAPARPAAELTPDEVAETLLQQEVAWSDEAARR